MSFFPQTATKAPCWLLAAGWRPTFHPPAPPWMGPGWFLALLALSFALCVGLVVYLYAAQRRAAPRGIVTGLTIVRALLLVLVFAALTGPGCRIVRESDAAATVWLVLDRSGSMGRADAQATPLEALRWADALGLLPAEARASPFSRQAARLAALQADANRRHAAAGEADPGGDVKKWLGRLADVTAEVENDPAGKAEAETLATLRAVAAAVGRGAEAGDAASWREAAALTPAVEALRAAADRADAALLARNDPRVRDAVAKAAAMSRAQLARGALGGGAAGLVERLPHASVKVLGFGDEPQVIPLDRTDAAAAKAIDAALADPAAPATDLAAALRRIDDLVGPDEPASVVVVSDGRQNRGGDAAAIARRLAGRGVRVFAAAVGSRQVVPDAAVEDVDAPDWVFKGDPVRLSAVVRLDGLAGRPADVELRRFRAGDPAGGVGELLDTKRVTATADAPRTLVTFAESQEQAAPPGVYDYRVEVKPVAGEAVAENNRRAVRVSVRNHKLNALVIEDQPRWEYRYVANFLARDRRVKLQTVLLQAARIDKVTPPPPAKASPLNDRTDAQTLPETQDEWYPFDLIVLGDVPPGGLPPRQQEMIAKAVTDRGAALVFLAGPLNFPSAWGGPGGDQPLSQLLPVEPSPDWTAAALEAHVRQGFHPAPAPGAAHHPLAQLGADDGGNARAWAAVAGDPDLAWYWHSDFTLARGGAEVVWTITDGVAPAALPGKRDALPGPSPRLPASEGSGPAVQRLRGGSSGNSSESAFERANRRALLVTMNAGLGKVMYLAGDATWRLRQVNGQNLHERFWGQVVRWAVGDDLPAGGRLARFGTDKPAYVAGEPAVVTARVVDEKGVPRRGLKLKAVARGTGDAAARAEADLTESADAPGRYRATFAALPPGRVEISLEGADLPPQPADDPAILRTLTVEVRKEINLEQQNLSADPAALAAVAAAGGGVAVDANCADVLADALPELHYRRTAAEQVGLFTDATEPGSRYAHYAFLALFLALVTAEWVIRKAAGLV